MNNSKKQSILLEHLLSKTNVIPFRFNNSLIMIGHLQLYLLLKCHLMVEMMIHLHSCLKEVVLSLKEE